MGLTVRLSGSDMWYVVLLRMYEAGKLPAKLQVDSGNMGKLMRMAGLPTLPHRPLHPEVPQAVASRPETMRTKTSAVHPPSDQSPRRPWVTVHNFAEIHGPTGRTRAPEHPYTEIWGLKPHRPWGKHMIGTNDARMLWFNMFPPQQKRDWGCQNLGQGTPYPP